MKRNTKKRIDRRLSDCCGAPPVFDIIDGIGICSRCKEWAGFDNVEFSTDNDIADLKSDE